VRFNELFNWLDKAGGGVQDFVMNRRRSCHLAFAFCAAIVCTVFPPALTASETFNFSPTNSMSTTFCYPHDDLGAIYRPQSTTLKLWAPTALGVEIMLFENATAPSVSTIPMTCDRNGIWSVTLKGDFDGKYYLYRITFPGAIGDKPKVVQVNDPCARGCSANTGRTLIYDPVKTNPEGWDRDQFVALKNNVDAILYEVHVRDFSINTNSGISHRGKFLGLVEAGTTTPDGEKSGLDHLTELGITHVHLLPVNDYAGGDERQKEYTWYNWGYDPVLFNTPEGSYASDPDGTARQKEFKRMIQSFHQRNIGVVMDVVFNHTASVGFKSFSIFDQIVPGYFYRTDASGRYANGTGCGNEVASERPMVRKFIVDCIKYWMAEYHVDGFRFDLMGILDRDTMTEVSREAKRINPNTIIYGEGWDMEKVLPAKMMMTQVNVQETGIAAFNDGMRDNIKGDVGRSDASGFVQGAGPQYGGVEQFRLNIKGQSAGRVTPGINVFSPNETVNYDSAHDDLCLWDKLLSTMPSVPENLRINMDKLAAGIVLTAQGVPFIHAGDEFLRSKNLVSNSYDDNNPAVNPIDWSLKAKHKDIFDFYRGLILLRKAHPAFRLTESAAVDKALDFATNVPANVIEYVIRNNANGDSWKNILVVYNGTGQSHELTVKGKWIVVADSQRAGIKELEKVQDRIRVEPFSLVIAHTEGRYRFDLK
jgi:pullulanase